MSPEDRELHNRRVDAEIMKLVSEAGKLNAETAKLTSENRWYLLVVGSAATLTIVAVVKLFL